MLLVAVAVVGVTAIALMVAHGRDAETESEDSQPTSLRLGYQPNLTHAPALVGIEEGTFQRSLGRTRLEPQPFNAGPDAALALMSGAIDAAYLGPSPVVNAYVHSDGEALRVVAGATSGGAALVVRKGIASPADLRGATIATPQLGGTQDVALRWWLAANGMATDPEGGGVAEIRPQKNGQTIAAFRQGILDGAWLPEPWASRLVVEAGAHVLVDERDLWPTGQDLTTVLVVRTRLLEQHPDLVERLLRGQVAATDFIDRHPEEAEELSNRAIAKVTGERLSAEVLSSAWRRLGFGESLDPDALVESAARANSVGLLPSVDLERLIDLRILGRIRAAAPHATTVN